MSRQAMLSIVGLERLNPDIWDFMAYPEGWTDDEKQNLLDNIRLECYELEVIYTDSVFMMNAIGRWSRKERPVWNALKQTMEYSYNPIENTDRYEEETVKTNNQKENRNQGTESRMGSNNENETANRLHSGTDRTETTGNVTNGGNDITVNEVQGYDSAAYAPHDKNTVTYGGTQTSRGTQNVTHGLNIADTSQKNGGYQESLRKENSDIERGQGETGRTLHTHGNIGTMTVQQMIREERDISKFNLVDYIVDSFKQRFCILVY